MYLSKLEIQGFKSFASGTVLDFQRGITAIVGPNGSGKSNVADSIRWVLGEQSLKLLRGKKSEDVIFAGSDKKSRLGVAEVSLFLNNEDRSAPIDYSELVITRRVYRDGTGEYLINHHEARLQDIQLLLAQANFGQRTYSVIGQGMIDSFLVSSPQERKHLFDEAAGVRQYQMKKDQAVNKLNQTKENLLQGQAIMTEIEPRLRSLTRQVRRLEKRELVEKDLRRKQVLYFGLRWQEVTTELAELQAQWKTLEKQRAEVSHEQGAIQHELDILERERSASEVFAGLQQQYNRILDQKNQLLEQQAMLKGRLEAAAKQAGAGETAFLVKRATEVKSGLDEVKALRATIAQSITKQRAASTQEQKTLDATEQEFRAVEKKLQSLAHQLDSAPMLPEAAVHLKSVLKKYREFVASLAEETFDLHSLYETAKGLEAELVEVLEMMHAADADEDIGTASTLQQSVLALAEQRQQLTTKLMSRQTELRLAENQDEQLKDQEEKLSSEYQRLTKEVDLENLAKTNPAEAEAAYSRELKNIEQQVGGLDETLKEARAKIQNFNELETTKKERLFTLQKHFRDTQNHLNVVTNNLNDLQVKIARVEQRWEDMKREAGEAMGATAVDDVEAEAKKELSGDVMLLAEEIGHLRKQLELIGGIDEQITNEYQETNERWEFLKKQSDDLEAAMSELEKAIGELDAIIKQRFDAAFKKINQEFNTFFRSLFRGGRAELVLVKEIIREDDDLTEAQAAAQEFEIETAPVVGEKVVTGIDIKATPPGKRLQGIAMLSGGERALTSIALLCAIISNNPSPFVVLDEVDAALDEANSQRFAAILEQLAQKSQFVTITHNRATMEKSHTLYGVTMGDDGVSQLLSVKMEQVEEIIKKHGNR